MKWSVLTLVGADQPGIVASVTDALYQAGCSLGQASMMRLGANFAIMLRVAHSEEADLSAILDNTCSTLNLHLHIDKDADSPVIVEEPDVQITVYGADRSGIVAQVTNALAEAGMNVIDLETDLAGSNEKPIYIMRLEGLATRGVDALRQALEELHEDIEVNIDEIETLRG